MVYAALEGAAVGIRAGPEDGEIEAGIASYATVGRRNAVTDTGFVTLVDDCYNANPESMRCAIDSMAAFSGRKVCLLADMLEMGADSPQMHLDLGRCMRLIRGSISWRPAVRSAKTLPKAPESAAAG